MQNPIILTGHQSLWAGTLASLNEHLALADKIAAIAERGVVLDAKFAPRTRPAHSAAWASKPIPKKKNCRTCSR
jgi:hypothetical protein